MHSPILAPSVDDSLMQAVIQSSNAPLMLLDGYLTIIVASQSFGKAFGIDSAAIKGDKLTAIGAGEWNVPQLESLLLATAHNHAAIEAYEMDLKRTGMANRKLVINVRKLDYSDGDNTRLLLTVLDVTDARVAEKLNDDLLREKGILLQELQHRVANSLQIIASVLLQSAKRSTSDETRINLHDAHHRIMSVGTLQQQLAASRSGEVDLRAYFSDLCRSIGASMISDHDRITLDVVADDGVSTAEVSISLGLIVTELVINALKHAFPDGRIGHITVGYRSQGADWTLSVSDDGVGMPAGTDAPKPGLGTNIVAALASSLEAQVKSTNSNPGVCVEIIHHESP